VHALHNVSYTEIIAMRQPELPELEIHRSTSELNTATAERFRDDLLNRKDQSPFTYPTEVTIGAQDRPIQLPGLCFVQAGPNDTMTFRQENKLGQTTALIEVDPTGVRTEGQGRFSIRTQGDTQIITTPGGAVVHVRDGRITEATSYDHRTEFLTPQEAKERAQRQETERQLTQMRFIQATQGVADQLATGVVPVPALRDTFTSAAFREWGKENTPVETARTINRMLRDQQSDTRVTIVQNIKNNTLDVRVRQTDGTFTNIPIDLNRKAK
jgi:hypothetical protein